ncbi:hypothetical protein GALL_325780 [mine drainage metagenome]|uniref:DUF2946 domain-containing protein n=1 Tax=mine drainage metagenome TaxID=410659 RepID=A0A1J5QQC7_9ZZZZ
MSRLGAPGYDTAADPRVGRMRRRVAAVLGLLLMAFNLLLGSGISAEAAGAGHEPLFAQELLSGHIVVCTAGGLVVLDRSGHPVDHHGAAGHSDFCVFCVPLLHGGLDTAAAATLPMAVETPQPAALPQPVFRTPAPVRLAGAASPRAPPRS